MENRQNFARMAGLASPKASTFNKFKSDQRLGSPKFARTKPEARKAWGKKPEGNVQMGQKICYISPTKHLDHLSGGCDSTQSLASLQMRPWRKQIHESSENLQNIFSNIPPRHSASTTSLHAHLTSPPTREYETAQEIISKTKISAENTDLKNQLKNITQKYKQSNEKQTMMREENNYLYKKIEEFNGLISEKNAIIDRLEALLNEKDAAIGKLRVESNGRKMKVEDLEATIVQLRKNLEESSSHCQSCTIISAEETDCGQQQKQNEQVDLEEEISKYKDIVVGLSSQLKYSQLQESIIKKLRHDLQSENQKNQRLRTQNRKLLNRIELLVNEDKKTAYSPQQARVGMMGRQCPVRRKQSEILFELSPEKDSE